jgi:hypothetical protein
VAAGAKRLGRETLKISLAQRTAPLHKPAAAWPKLLAAAAVIGILIGVGLVQRWFTGGTQQDMETDRVTESAEKAHPQPEKPGEVRSTIRSESRQSPEEGAREADQLAGAASKQDQGKEHPGRVTFAASPQRTQEAAPRPLTANAETPRSEAAGKSVRSRYWTEGVELSQANESLLRDKRTAKVADSYDDFRREETKAKGGLDLKEVGQSVQRAGGNYRITQRKSSELPLMRQLQQNAPQKRVQTMIELEGNVTTLTLYLDSLVDESDLQRANVEATTVDSLVVNVGKQRIGYKLPADLTNQQNRPAK